jgi:hypothetical protein
VLFAKGTALPSGMNPWEKIREHLKGSVKPQDYSTWVEPARFSHVEEDVLFIRVPNKTFRDFWKRPQRHPPRRWHKRRQFLISIRP